MRSSILLKKSGLVCAQACAIAVMLSFGACAVPPVSPSVAVLPGGGKGMQAFNADDIACREYAASPKVDDGTSLAGMGLGKIEVASGRRGFAPLAGSVNPVGTGSVFGGAAAQDSGEPPTAQQKYDTAYIRCMFSKGHKVPVSGGMTS